MGDIPHIHFFTSKSLEILFLNYGFKTLTISEDKERDAILALFQLQYM